MSKVKSPQEKKTISLKKDRRNIYGECPTSSRKNIRRGKQRSHREMRRASSQVLSAIKGAHDDLNADEKESKLTITTIELQRHAFKKKPDAPLGLVIRRKRDWRSKER
jgi:hypothetical protein